ERLSGTLDISGRIGDRAWMLRLPIANAAPGTGLSKLWARRKIADQEVARTLHRVTPDEANARILALALEHHLVTRLPSLVAVDRTPSRPDGARLVRSDLPLNLPAGWDFDALFGGERPAPPERSPVERRADMMPRPTTLARAGTVLPRTSTDAQLSLL